MCFEKVTELGKDSTTEEFNQLCRKQNNHNTGHVAANMRLGCRSNHLIDIFFSSPAFVLGRYGQIYTLRDV